MTGRGRFQRLVAAVPAAAAVLAAAAAVIAAGCAGADDPWASRSAAGTVDYECEGGRRIEATYTASDTAVVVRDGETTRMVRARSASGARYVGGGLQWWSRGTGPGSEATLSRHDAASDEVTERLATCREVPEMGEVGDQPQA